MAGLSTKRGSFIDESSYYGVMEIAYKQTQGERCGETP